MKFPVLSVIPALFFVTPALFFVIPALFFVIPALFFVIPAKAGIQSGFFTAKTPRGQGFAKAAAPLLLPPKAALHFSWRFSWRLGVLAVNRSAVS